MFSIKQSKIQQAINNMGNGMLGAVIASMLVGGGLVGASTSNYWQSKILSNESSITAAVTQSNNLNSSIGVNQQKIDELKAKVAILESRLPSTINSSTVRPPNQTVTTIGNYTMVIAAENNQPYNRDDYGSHNNSTLCQNADRDPYTGIQITQCHVDHVVSLKEAHQSGSFIWNNSKKKSFSQYQANHLASQACINLSKQDSDLARMALCSYCQHYRLWRSGFYCFAQRPLPTSKNYLKN